MKMTHSSAAQLLAATALLAIGGTAAQAEEVKVPAPVITSAQDAQWFPMIPEMGETGPAMAVVFGEPGVLGKPFGGLFRVPSGGLSPLHTHSSEYWAVMLEGTESARILTEDEAMPIAPGSYWFQPGEAVHVNECLSEEDCVFFGYFPNGLDYLPADH